MIVNIDDILTLNQKNIQGLTLLPISDVYYSNTCYSREKAWNKGRKIPLKSIAGLKADGVKKIDISVVEIDSETKSLRIIINGDCLNYKDLRSNIARRGAVVNSVDQVIVQ